MPTANSIRLECLRVQIGPATWTAGAARLRDLFEAGLNEAAVAFAAIYGRSMRDAGFRRLYLEFEKQRRPDDGLLEGWRQLMTTAVARDLQWGERQRCLDGVIERHGSPSAPIRRGDASVGKFADLD